ncbi:MAG TPA: hypothetical protein DCP55_04545 [Chitinophagaceae bacterium]|nr:hypothetical protein [bacterium]HAL95221.1 hypothetical protein [Chitinophagaceae bacterium]
MNLDAFIKKQPNFSIPTTYFKVTSKFSTVISFYNYFKEIFPDLETPVTLNVFIFNSGGLQVAHKQFRLVTGESTQISLRELCAEMEGMVCCVAVPEFNLEDFARDKIVLRTKVSTGFYVTWFDDSNHVDIMHEWNTVSAGVQPFQTSFLNYSFLGGVIRPGVILMNTTHTSNREGFAEPLMQLYTMKNGKQLVLQSKSIDPIPPMGTRVIDIYSLFGEARHFLEQYGTLGLSVSSANLPLPLTIESHESGDFHIHHG